MHFSLQLAVLEHRTSSPGTMLSCPHTTHQAGHHSQTSVFQCLFVWTIISTAALLWPLEHHSEAQLPRMLLLLFSKKISPIRLQSPFSLHYWTNPWNCSSSHTLAYIALKLQLIYFSIFIELQTMKITKKLEDSGSSTVAWSPGYLWESPPCKGKLEESKDLQGENRWRIGEGKLYNIQTSFSSLTVDYVMSGQ